VRGGVATGKLQPEYRGKYGSPEAAPLLVLIMAGAAGGAVLRLWKGNGPGGELYRLDEALGRGETVMVLDVDDGRISAVESKVNSRHPAPGSGGARHGSPGDATVSVTARIWRAGRVAAIHERVQSEARCSIEPSC